MKLTNFDNPVMSSWFSIKGARLDSKPYLSGALEARVLLEKLHVEKQPLYKVTKGELDGIFNGPRFARVYVETPDYGIPFLGSTDILAADLSTLPLLAKKIVQHYPSLLLQKDWTLITCSGTIGRTAYSRSDMISMAGSQHFMRVVPDPDKILPGYLYAYLSSKFGIPQVIEGTYGAIIQHIEPSHIAGLPVPRLGSDLENNVHQNITKAAHLRCEYQAQVKLATEKLFTSIGLQDITTKEWYAMGSDLGFSHAIKSSDTLRAVNFNPRLKKILDKLSLTNHMLLGDICKNGILRRGQRFKRIECEPEFGVRLIGQKELFWMEPEGRWVSSERAPNDIFVKDETVLVTSQGALSDAFARTEFVTGPWVQYAYTEHLLRVRSGNPSISNPFLFAFLRSETAFRCLRSFCIGSAQQDIHHALLFRLPVPIPHQSVRNDIDRLVREAYQKRHEASRLERTAVEIVETAIEEGAKWQSLSR